jgi:hypothetical protein
LRNIGRSGVCRVVDDPLRFPLSVARGLARVDEDLAARDRWEQAYPEYDWVVRDRLVGVEEVAFLLGISEERVLQLAGIGLPASVTVGGKRRWHLSVLGRRLFPWEATTREAGIAKVRRQVTQRFVELRQHLAEERYNERMSQLSGTLPPPRRYAGAIR